MITERHDTSPDIELASESHENGHQAQTTLTSTDDKRKKRVPVALRPSIPIVFLPGVMGSVLKNKDTKEIVWAPPNIGLSLWRTLMMTCHKT